MKIGILNSGGGCPGTEMYVMDVVRAVREKMPLSSVVGIPGGFTGLMGAKEKEIEDGCSFIKTSRISCSAISDDDIEKMKTSAKASGLDSLVIFGGDDTAKTALRLSDAGIKCVFIPKTIDNNVFKTDDALGFHSAYESAADAILGIGETARSSSRIMIAEIEGDCGWLTLFAGVAGGADILLLPEVPYSYKGVFKAIEEQEKKGRDYAVIAISSGAMTQEEYRMSEAEKAEKRRRDGESYISLHLASVIRDIMGKEAQAVIPSHTMRSGGPCAYDRLLSRRFAAEAANLIRSGEGGLSVVTRGTEVAAEELYEVAKKMRRVPYEDGMVATALSLGASLGV